MRVLAAAVVLFLLGLGPAQGAIIHQYRLDGSYADDLGGPSLVAAGGTLDATKYTFGGNEGLSLTGGLTSPSVYSIELQFEFDDVVGYQKIIDFKNRTDDRGLYVLNGQLNFYNFATAGTVTPNTYTTLVITRDSSNVVRTYLDGIAIFSFSDSASAAVFSIAGNPIQFFKDDLTLSGAENSPGSVNYIRIYDSALSGSEVASLVAPTNAPVPEPATLLIWSGLGACGFILARRRKRAE